MNGTSGTETRDYVRAVLRRGLEPLEPVGFEPDWADKPWRYKVYDGVTRLRLSTQPTPTGPVGSVLHPPASHRTVTMDTLSDLLLHSYGLLARRLALTGNNDSDALPWLTYAGLGRGTASGGGLYPVEIYWAAGRGAATVAGVYHYASQHHAMERILTGDVTPRIRAATGLDADQFLLLSVKIWKNSFKYNTFSYHVVTTDIGTLLGTWNLWARASGLPLQAVFWFAEPDLNHLLGLQTELESVFAVVPLGTPVDSSVGAAADGTALGAPAVGRGERERSKRIVRFDRVDRVHAAAVSCGQRPFPGALRAGASVPPARTEYRDLPAPEAGRMNVDVRTALRMRRSSFGGFRAVPPMTGAELSDVLAVATAGGQLTTDVSDPTGWPTLTRVAVFVNHVHGLPPGVYDYDPQANRLGVVDLDTPGRFLQSRYFLDNYNLEQAAAVLAVIGRPDSVLTAVGDRGYRVLNAEVGAVAQAAYTGAAAAGLGCGAVFGFENVAVRDRLQCGPDEWPLLLVLLGHERDGVPEIDHRLV